MSRFQRYNVVILSVFFLSFSHKANGDLEIYREPLKLFNQIQGQKLRGPTLDICTQNISQAKHEGVEVSVLDDLEIQALLDYLDRKVKEGSIPSKYLEDGCYARAHEASLYAGELGVNVGKAFIIPSENERLLYPHNYSESVDFHSSFTGWHYHSAIFVLRRDQKGEVSPAIIDIGLYDRPMPVEEWQKAMSSQFRQGRQDFRPQVIFRDKEYIFHDSDYKKPGESIIARLRETQGLIDDIGYDEYLFRLERGWIP